MEVLQEDLNPTSSSRVTPESVITEHPTRPGPVIQDHSAVLCTISHQSGPISNLLKIVHQNYYAKQIKVFNLTQNISIE